MTDEERARPNRWDRTYQIGVVVRDLDQAKAFYERLGIGPFEEGPSAHTLERSSLLSLSSWSYSLFGLR